jgi:hypothetical protein
MNYFEKERKDQRTEANYNNFIVGVKNLNNYFE